MLSIQQDDKLISGRSVTTTCELFVGCGLSLIMSIGFLTIFSRPNIAGWVLSISYLIFSFEKLNSSTRWFPLAPVHACGQCCIIDTNMSTTCRIWIFKFLPGTTLLRDQCAVEELGAVRSWAVPGSDQEGHHCCWCQCCES